MITGILNIDKPAGWTSHDVVARTRRLADQKRVGHTGTLDPSATGVLVVCLGQATRIVEYVAEGIKAYRARIRFGETTDTWDADGEVLRREAVAGLSLASVEAAIPEFRGRVEQVPPMYSALKHRGVPLYRLARQGVTIERAPRTVEIYGIEVVDWQLPDLVLDVKCSKGTYVRSLAHELGQVLGVGAHLAGLVRTAVGPFSLAEAVSLGTLEAGNASGAWLDHLLPIDCGIQSLPTVAVDEDTARRIGFGQQVSLEAPRSSHIRAYDSNRRLLAIMQPMPDGELWKPHKVFVPS